MSETNQSPAARPHALNPIKGSPAKMLSDFSNTQTFIWVGVAIVIHIAIIGGVSLAFPGGDILQNMTQSNAANTPASNPASQPAAASVNAAQTPTPANNAPTNTAEANKAGSNHGNSKIMKALTETAPAPKDSGINVDIPD